ncbi:MAG: PepSY domain-containing protein [Vicinamibacterales bacterium]|nr:PepSY domain-containing protein [Vicinamibacterales bacterium]
MVKLRPILFWLHLTCGVVAGVVILTMSVTGALLTYQRQITAWSDMRGYHSEPQENTRRLPGDALVAAAAASRADLTPATLVIRSDRSAPASLGAGAGRQVFVNPYSGEVLGEGNGQSARNFFRLVTEWHRYVGASGGRRPMGRAITGASNLMFLFIVLSGLFLWWPRTWTWAAVRSVVWFRRGLPGKARDFNWHNTIGFWSAIPLAAIVAGGVVISYPWATALVYRAYQEEPPATGGALAARGGGPGGRARGPGEHENHESQTASARAPLETLIARAETQMPEWRSISVALPASDAQRVTLTLDAGDGGQPHKRATLTLDRRTAEVVRWEPYSSQSPGRRARTWLRFAHTGEVYGIAGQTLAGVVTSGGAVLVWTGLALALRRFTAWRGRRP